MRSMAAALAQIAAVPSLRPPSGSGRTSGRGRGARATPLPAIRLRARVCLATMECGCVRKIISALKDSNNRPAADGRASFIYILCAINAQLERNHLTPFRTGDECFAFVKFYILHFISCDEIERYFASGSCLCVSASCLFSCPLFCNHLHFLCHAFSHAYFCLFSCPLFCNHLHFLCHAFSHAYFSLSLLSSTKLRCRVCERAAYALVDDDEKYRLGRVLHGRAPPPGGVVFRDWYSPGSHGHRAVCFD